MKAELAIGTLVIIKSLNSSETQPDHEATLNKIGKIVSSWKVAKRNIHYGEYLVTIEGVNHFYWEENLEPIYEF